MLKYEKKEKKNININMILTLQITQSLIYLLYYIKRLYTYYNNYYYSNYLQDTATTIYIAIT